MAAPGTALPIRTAYALAVVSGVLYFLSFPGIELWPLSFVALTPLYVALRGQPVKHAVGLGWLAGLTMTMTGFYWLVPLLEVFAGFSGPSCLFIMIFLCAYQGGRIALCGGLYGSATAQGWPAPLCFSLAFAASELADPLLLPWYFGASVHQVPALLQCADAGGPILVGLVLVVANLAVGECILALRDKRPIPRPMLAVGIAVPVLAALYGVVRIRQVDVAIASAKAVQVGLVQANQPLLDRKRSVIVHKRLTAALKQQGAELVVWSEGAVPYSFSETRYRDILWRNITRDIGVSTIFGVKLERRPAEARTAGESSQHSPSVFISAVLAGDSGQIVGRYDKQILLAFGEYLPLGQTFPILYKWLPNVGAGLQGTSGEPLQWGEHRILASICYEDIQPTLINKMVRHADPDLMVNLTNDAWFGNTTEPWIHFALAKFRAIEHRRYLVRATNSGVSAIIDAKGGTVVQGGTFKEEALVGQARFMRGRTVYEQAGNLPWYAVTLLVVGMAVLPRPRRRTARMP